jgi:hypothetical protein
MEHEGLAVVALSRRYSGCRRGTEGGSCLALEDSWLSRVPLRTSVCISKKGRRRRIEILER